MVASWILVAAADVTTGGGAVAFADMAWIIVSAWTVDKANTGTAVLFVDDAKTNPDDSLTSGRLLVPVAFCTDDELFSVEDAVTVNMLIDIKRREHSCTLNQSFCLPIFHRLIWRTDIYLQNDSKLSACTRCSPRLTSHWSNGLCQLTSVIKQILARIKNCSLQTKYSNYIMTMMPLLLLNFEFDNIFQALKNCYFFKGFWRGLRYLKV